MGGNQNVDEALDKAVEAAKERVVDNAIEKGTEEAKQRIEKKEENES
jgi:hypothetical protein